jgi:threonine dehydrogenase-like Zn-dependent dehydrogenase
LTGCSLGLIGHHRKNLALARRWGASTWLEGDGGFELADLVVECTGNPAGLDLAFRHLRPRGTLVLKSTFAGAGSDNWASIVVDEITVVGSRCGPFDGALRLLERGLVDVKPLVDGVFPLDQAEAALRHAARPGVLKVLISGS